MNTMKQLLYALTALCLCACEGEKALNIVEGNLPIMTSTLYMVGDATPAGWSIDAPTALTPSEDNSLVFGYEGELKAGEFKLCLVPGSWDVPFIRPDVAGAEIGTAPVVDAPFQMHAGDPDDKWRVSSPGIYRLAFNLRQWTMSAERLGDIPEQPEQPREPIAAEALYMVGDATPAGWNIDAPTAFAQKDSHIFIYEGPLTVGEFKCCTQTGSWDAPFIRPATAGEELTRAGFEAHEFAMHAGDPDDKWHVADEAVYRLTFDLAAWTVKAEYVKDIERTE